MKFKDLILSSAVAVGTLVSCDALDIAPDGTLTMEEVFSDPDKVSAFLNTCYTNLPYKSYFYHGWEQLPTAVSDDGWTTWDGGNDAAAKIYGDRETASDHPVRDAYLGDAAWSLNNYWARYWDQIRLCSQFIENIDGATVRSEAERDRMRAEAHVLRAYFYSELVKWFGRVPVLDGTLGFEEDFSRLKRESVYNVVKFIEQDCNMAIYSEHLPWRITSDSEALRATKALAWTIKSKMMLFAASPLFNEGNDYWEEAYECNAQAVAQLKANGYGLFKVCTNPNTFGTGKAAAFRQLMCQAADYAAEPRDRETIWQHNTGSCFVWHIGYIGSSHDGTYSVASCPTQELADAFNTTDGEPILNLEKPYNDPKHLQPNFNSKSIYDENNPYANRDPRMAETMLYNGAPYTYQGISYNLETFEGGRNHISLNPAEDDFTRTGYYHCKLVQPGASAGTQYDVYSPGWKYFRLAEVILNYAEAAAEAGHLTEAKDAVDEIRARVGMPALPSGLTKEEMILRVRNERRVELAWEECRYFDLRRWQNPDGDLKDYQEWLTGMRPLPQSDGTFRYERYNIWTKERGGCSRRDLLLPIPVDEVARMESLTGEKWQNPGW